jgi:hypothetical protein
MAHKKWLKLALNDLQSAEILYAAGFYRNAWYLFGQSVEKFAKGYSLFSGFGKEDEFEKKISHKALKLFNAPAKAYQKDIAETVQAFDNNPMLKSCPLIDENKLRDYAGQIESFERDFEKLLQAGPDALTDEQVDEWLECLNDLRLTRFVVTPVLNERMQSLVKQLAEWVGSFGTAKAQQSKDEIQQGLQSGEFHRAFILLIQSTKYSLSASLTAFIFSFVTKDSNTATRYPKQGTVALEKFNRNDRFIRRFEDFALCLRYALSCVSKLEKLQRG